MKTIRIYTLSICIALAAFTANAQQINTLFFLENAPMRHTINPAFQPVSSGFISFSPLGWTTTAGGNTSLTLSDLVYVDPITGNTITPLHPNGNKKAFLKQMQDMTLVNGELTMGILNMGFRIKEKGYLTIGLNERFELGTSIPKSLPQFLFGGGMTNFDGGTNTFDLSRLGIATTVYTELGIGYSKQINDKWTIGGKLKVLLGQANIGFNSKNLTLDANIEQWHMRGKLQLEMAAPINFQALPLMDNQSIEELVGDFQNGNVDLSQLVNFNDITAMVLPSGYGAAIDLGLTFKPIENLQISAALNDFGAIYWTNAQKYTCSIDTTFVGVGEFEYSDPAFYDEQGNFSTQLLVDSAMSNLYGLTKGIRMQQGNAGYLKMISARLNIGVDANFCNNKIGVGLLSSTRLYNARLYEEITLGLSFKPCNWFNIAASYSLMQNGKFSNIGAGLSFMPKDGINLTLAMDYIPTNYAGIETSSDKTIYVLPYKTKMLNLALGFSICWGTNKKIAKAEKDATNL
jgi:hypothetical protein